MYNLYIKKKWMEKQNRIYVNVARKTLRNLKSKWWNIILLAWRNEVPSKQLSFFDESIYKINRIFKLYFTLRFEALCIL